LARVHNQWCHKCKIKVGLPSYKLLMLSHRCDADTWAGGHHATCNMLKEQYTPWGGLWCGMSLLNWWVGVGVCVSSCMAIPHHSISNQTSRKYYKQSNKLIGQQAKLEATNLTSQPSYKANKPTPQSHSMQAIHPHNMSPPKPLTIHNKLNNMPAPPTHNMLTSKSNIT